MSEVKAFWSQDENQEGQLEPRLDLKFNYPVMPAQLASRLHVYHGATELPAELVTNNAGEQITVRFTNNTIFKDDALPVRVSITPGLSTSGSTYETKLPLDKEVLFPSRQYLQIAEVTTGIEEGQEQIFVSTTQPVHLDNLHELITLQPRVDFAVEERDGGFVIKGNIPQENTYELTISKNLTGLEGVKLGKNYFHTVMFEDVRPGISFVNSKSIYLSSQGARNIALNVVKCPA